MVVTRQNCSKSNIKCRNCAHPHWRSSCLKPTYIRHIMPMPFARALTKKCDEVLNVFDPLDPTDCADTTRWTSRIPSCTIR
eukprot:2998386-Prymnesium_polylepis.1